MCKFSIIVPTYNVERYVQAAMLSVIDAIKLFENEVEVIIVDDNSNDGTWEKLIDYKNTKCFKVIGLKDHVGLGAVRNIGLSKAIGEYILFLDSDDLLANDILLKLNNVISKENPDLIIFQWRSISEKGQCRSIEYGDGSVEGMQIACWNKCYRLNVIKDQKFPEGVFFEDTGYSLIARKKAKKVFFFHRSFTFIGIGIREYQENIID